MLPTADVWGWLLLLLSPLLSDGSGSLLVWRVGIMQVVPDGRGKRASSSRSQVPVDTTSGATRVACGGPSVDVR